MNFPTNVVFGAPRCRSDIKTINGKCSLEYDVTLSTPFGTSNEVRKVSMKQWYCPIGYEDVINETENDISTLCKPIQPEPPCACQDEHLPVLLRYLEWVGNPINPSTGVKMQSELDYNGEGSNSLKFVRTYRSDRRGWAHNYLSFGVNLSSLPSNYLNTEHPCIMGVGFDDQPYCYPYAPSKKINDFLVQRAAGQMIRFGTDIDWSPSKNINDRLMPVLSNGAPVA